ncbi:MAG: hypothetical protein PSX81_13950 [bacterium]|nr:hypothetical protein [bacterium]
MKYYYGFCFLMFVIFACNSSPKTENVKNNNRLTSINQLLSDTFVEQIKLESVNTDSIEKAVLKKIKCESINSIEKFESEKIIATYTEILVILKQNKDSSKSAQNMILQTIFEKLDKQQAKIESNSEIEIKTKLLMAKTKSEIWPYFKK